MRSWPEYSNFFLSLLVIINPILAVPLFLSYTRGYSTAERRRAARLTSTTVLAALVAAALTGEALLRIFGTSLGAYLEAMLSRRIVGRHGACGQALHRPADQIPFGGVQVSAGWIDPQRPAHVAGPLPGRQRQRVEEELRDECPPGGSRRGATEARDLVKSRRYLRGDLFE